MRTPKLQRAQRPHRIRLRNEGAGSSRSVAPIHSVGAVAYQLLPGLEKTHFVKIFFWFLGFEVISVF